MPCLRRLKRAHDIHDSRREHEFWQRFTQCAFLLGRPGQRYSTAQLDSGGLVRPDHVYACREAFSSRVLDATIHAPWHVCATQIAHVPSHRLVTFGMEDQAVGCWRKPAGCWVGPRQAIALSFERIRDVLCVIDECPGLEVRFNRNALRLTMLMRKDASQLLSHVRRFYSSRSITIRVASWSVSGHSTSRPYSRCGQ